MARSRRRTTAATSPFSISTLTLTRAATRPSPPSPRHSCTGISHENRHGIAHLSVTTPTPGVTNRDPRRRLSVASPRGAATGGIGAATNLATKLVLDGARFARTPSRHFDRPSLHARVTAAALDASGTGLLTFPTPASSRSPRPRTRSRDGHRPRIVASLIADNNRLTSLTKACTGTWTRRRQHLHRRHDSHRWPLNLGSSRASGSSGTISVGAARSNSPPPTPQDYSSASSTPRARPTRSTPTAIRIVSPPTHRASRALRQTAPSRSRLSGPNTYDGGTTISAARCKLAPAARVPASPHIATRLLSSTAATRSLTPA